MRDPNDSHHWSSWPGAFSRVVHHAFCLKCGISDPYEIALADNKFRESDVTSVPIWIGTEAEWHEYIAKLDCRVKGILEWDIVSQQWKLNKATD